MSNKSKRRPPIPPRPQLFNEQMRSEILGKVGNGQRVLNREQSMFLVTALAANLERLLNSKEQLPWVTSSIEKRSDGFSLHVQVIEPSADSDAVVFPASNM